MFLSVLLLLANLSIINAKVQLPSIIGNNMVLQRNTEVCLWGKASQKARLTITPSWDRNRYNVTADEQGNWNVKVRTTDAGGPFSLEFNDGEVTLLQNILLGDVWLCSGQSNMEMPLEGLCGQPVNGSLNMIMESQSFPNIRMYTGQKTPAVTPQFDLKGQWNQSSIESSGKFSAIGYFYARELHKVLQIPIGIIHISWGAASIESWMGAQSLKLYPDIDLSNLKTDNAYPQKVATLLHNGMLRPVSNYSIKGILWYQGETNIPNYAQYDYLFPALVDEWRNLFKQPDLPFYYVQIAPYIYSGKEKEESAFLRESQLKSAMVIPHSGMVVTMDIGELMCIHPAEKEKVGQRLAYQALAKTYGFKNFPCDGPILKSMAIEKNKITLTFINAEMGLWPMHTDLSGFQIAGEDGRFVQATAVIPGFGDKVEVWSDNIANPMHIRYCFKNHEQGSLFNAYGLPASSFRTDKLAPIK